MALYVHTHQIFDKFHSTPCCTTPSSLQCFCMGWMRLEFVPICLKHLINPSCMLYPVLYWLDGLCRLSLSALNALMLNGTDREETDLSSCSALVCVYVCVSERACVWIDGWFKHLIQHKLNQFSCWKLPNHTDWGKNTGQKVFVHSCKWYKYNTSGTVVCWEPLKDYVFAFGISRHPPQVKGQGKHYNKQNKQSQKSRKFSQ